MKSRWGWSASHQLIRRYTVQEPHNVNDLSIEQTYRLRHFSRCLLRLAALGSLVIGIVPMVSSILGDAMNWQNLGSTIDSMVHFYWRYEQEAGFLITMWIIAAGLWIGQRRLARFIVPRMSPECPECGYELRRLTQPRCPECGTVLPRVLVSRADEHRSES